MQPLQPRPFLIQYLVGIAAFGILLALRPLMLQDEYLWALTAPLLISQMFTGFTGGWAMSAAAFLYGGVALIFAFSPGFSLDVVWTWQGWLGLCAVIAAGVGWATFIKKTHPAIARVPRSKHDSWFIIYIIGLGVALWAYDNRSVGFALMAMLLLALVLLFSVMLDGEVSDTITNTNPAAPAATEPTSEMVSEPQ